MQKLLDAILAYKAAGGDMAAECQIFEAAIIGQKTCLAPDIIRALTPAQFKERYGVEPDYPDKPVLVMQWN